MIDATNSSARESSFLAYLAVVGTITTWAASFPAIGFALRELEPLPLASIRFAFAAVPAVLWLAWRRPRALPASGYATVALCGLLGIALYNLLLNSGQATVSAGAASFIVNTQPLFQAGLAVLFLREAFNRWSWLGALLGFAGVAVIASGQPGGLGFGAGATLILGAAVSSAADSVLRRRLFARIDPIDVTALVLIIGAIALLPWLADGVAQTRAASGETVAAIVFLAFAPAVIGQTCWTYALKSFGAAHAGQFLYLVPPCAVVFSWLLLDEIPLWSTLAGGAVALAGVILVNTWGRKPA